MRSHHHDAILSSFFGGDLDLICILILSVAPRTMNESSTVFEEILALVRKIEETANYGEKVKAKARELSG